MVERFFSIPQQQHDSPDDVSQLLVSGPPSSEAGRPCTLVLPDTHHGDSPRLLYIYKRWVSSIYTIKGDGFGSFVLKNSYHSGMPNSETKKSAKYYSIALQYLVLEGITEDDGK